MNMAERIEAAASREYSPWTVNGDMIAPPAVGRVTFSNTGSAPPLRPAQRVVPTQAANDNRAALIGITGKRNVGKSTFARMLHEEYGYSVVHAFDSGKRAAVEYFRAIGCPEPEEMVYGRLKDVPSPYLPVNVAPRFYLEKSGHFHGHTLGVDWTLGMEINLARKANAHASIVVESLVYEAPWFKRQGGFVVRLVRPDHYGPHGIESDDVQALIQADVEIVASSVDELLEKGRALIRERLAN